MCSFIVNLFMCYYLLTFVIHSLYNFIQFKFLENMMAFIIFALELFQYILPIFACIQYLFLWGNKNCKTIHYNYYLVYKILLFVWENVQYNTISLISSSHNTFVQKHYQRV